MFVGGDFSQCAQRCAHKDYLLFFVVFLAVFFVAAFFFFAAIVSGDACDVDYHMRNYCYAMSTLHTYLALRSMREVRFPKNFWKIFACAEKILACFSIFNHARMYVNCGKLFLKKNHLSTIDL